MFSLAEGRVADGLGCDSGGGGGGGLQQAAAVQVGRVAGVIGPFRGGGLQPGADNTVGAGVGEPVVAQQRPGGESASWLISTASASRVSSRSAANLSRTTSTSCAWAAVLPAIRSARAADTVVSVPSLPTAVSRMNICRATSCWAAVSAWYARCALAATAPSMPPVRS